MRSRHHAVIAIFWWVISWLLAGCGGISFAMAEHIAIRRGIYWAMATVTTVGYGDIVPHNQTGFIIADVTMGVTIPIWSLAIAFATSWVTSWHIWHSHKKMKEFHNGKEQQS